MCGVVAIAELSVYQQAVVQHASVYYSLVFCIMPALVSCRYVGTEVPVVVLDKLVDECVYLRRQRS